MLSSVKELLLTIESIIVLCIIRPLKEKGRLRTFVLYAHVTLTVLVSIKDSLNMREIAKEVSTFYSSFPSANSTLDIIAHVYHCKLQCLEQDSSVEFLK